MEKYIFIYCKRTPRKSLTILPTSQIQELYMSPGWRVWISTEKKEYELIKPRGYGEDDENDGYDNICEIFFQFLNTEARTCHIECDILSSKEL